MKMRASEGMNQWRKRELQVITARSLPFYSQMRHCDLVPCTKRSRGCIVFLVQWEKDHSRSSNLKCMVTKNGLDMGGRSRLNPFCNTPVNFPVTPLLTPLVHQ